MDIVDEISYLSTKGEDYYSNEDFTKAKTYFINAANLALNASEELPAEEQLEFQNVAKSLLSLARNAHNLTFQKVETNYLASAEEREQRLNEKIRQEREIRLLEELTTAPKKDEVESVNALNVPLGRYIGDKKLLNWKPKTLMNGIFTITGGSGSGKTECLRSLATELIHQEVPVCILDLHGDLEIKGLKSISLDYRGNYSINPMEMTSKNVKDGGPTPHINRLMNQFTYAIRDRFSSTQKSWLRHLLNFVYEQKGIIQQDPSTWKIDPPTFSDLLDVIKYPEDWIMQTDNREYIRILDSFTNSTLVAVENRLAPILEHPAFSGDNIIQIDQLTSSPFRIDLKPLNTIDMQFMAADTLIRQLFAYLKSIGHVKEGKEKFRLFIMIDEVKILTGFRGKLNDPYHILNRLATEARKFGLGLILASQIFSHFGRDIKSNAASKLILRTMDIKETKRVAKEFKLKTEELRRLSRPGEGYISTSRAPEAQHIQLFPADIHPFELNKNN